MVLVKRKDFYHVIPLYHPAVIIMYFKIKTLKNYKNIIFRSHKESLSDWLATSKIMKLLL